MREEKFELNKQELISYINDFFINYFSDYSEEDFLSQTNLDDSVDDFARVIEYNFSQMDISFSCDGGADKNVIIFRDYDFVLKIPKISGLREVEIFNSAKREGYEKYFIPSYKINEIHFGEKTIGIYIQDKINIFKSNDWEYEDNDLSESIEISGIYSDLSEEYVVTQKSGTDSYILRSKRFVAYFFKTNQMNELENLLFFLQREGVNDLHSSNFIISKKRGLQIIDYSGYDDSDLYPDEDYGEYYDEYYNNENDSF